MTRPHGSNPPPSLHAPGWAAALLFAAAVTAAVCYPSWPGFMSYDSLFAYQQSITGIETGLWPPAHAYLFTVSRTLGAGTWGLFLLQTFVLFASAAVVIHLLVRNRIAAVVLCLAFAALFVAIPSQLGVLLVQWRDVPTASFSLLGLALWLLAARRSSRLLLIAAIAALSLALSLRYNAIMLVGGLLVLMAWRPFLRAPVRSADRALVVVVALALLVAAWASTKWRLPDLADLPAPNSLGGTQEFDLIGVSACAGRSYLPAAVTYGEPISPRQIRQAYDPRHLHLSLAAKPGAPQMQETDAGGDVARVWRHLLTHETRCYLEHRGQVFIQQMGMAKDGLFYPVHGFIDENPHGIELAHPEVADDAVAYVTEEASAPWRRPYLLYMAAAVLAAAVAAIRRANGPLLLGLVAGSYAYAGVLFVAAPAADARYIFPSNVFCCLVIVLALGLLLDPARRLRAAR